MSTQHTTRDWAALHRRLEQTAQSIDGLGRRSDEAEQALLLRRAQTMAQSASAPAVEEQLHIVEFSLAHENYAIASAFVREICPLKEITALPGVPPFLRGLINVRGQIIAVIDIKRFFALPERGLTDLNKVIIVHDQALEFGILADSIIGARELPLSDIQPPLPTLTGIHAEYLHGITGQGLVVLDAQRFIHHPALVVNDTL